MSEINTPAAQFSIYKIDLENVVEAFKLKDSHLSAQEALSLISDNIKSNLYSRKNCKIHHQIDYNGFHGYVYQTEHEPDWKMAILFLLSKSESKKQSNENNITLNNLNVSYVLLYLYKSCLYAMTGGFGSKLISRFIEKNYGLYLLPKFMKRDDHVLRIINQDFLTGNRISTNRTNRTTTSFSTEQDLSGIFKELNVEINSDLASALGLDLDEAESPNKRVHLINKDSIVIRRLLSFDELAITIRSLNHLERQEARFALNYLVQIRKKRIKKSTLLDQLADNFMNMKYTSFIIVGESYTNYLIDASKYIIFTESRKTFLQSIVPITLTDIFQKLTEEDIRLSHHFILKLLREWKVATIGPDGSFELYPRPIIDSIQGFIEFGKENKPYYLINSEWYVFDDLFDELLNLDFKKLFNEKEQTSTTLKTDYNLILDAKTEEEYNTLLEDNPRIIVSHRCNYNNVEFADAIFWDDEKLYLLHNKGKFNGIGARDLLNQMLTSAECLRGNHTIIGIGFLRTYYRTICDKYGVNELSIINEDDFLKLFENKEICYVAGFLEGYKDNSKSTYAKYLTIEAHRKLSDHGISFIPLGIK